jgi:hypothetical protein
MTYSEKLKDPRWQRKRLEILERDGFKCKHCQSEDKTLHVHHKLYRKGKMPWDYEDEVFITLCHECHESAEIRKESILLMVGRYPSVDRTISTLLTACHREITHDTDFTYWSWAIFSLAGAIREHDDFREERINYPNGDPDEMHRYSAHESVKDYSLEVIENVIKAREHFKEKYPI